MIDLHFHSTFSDGSLTPEELAARAAEAGLTAAALTDHDSCAGVPRFMAAATEAGVASVAGVEISADYQPGTMHMLGYGFDPEDRNLEEHLAWIREGREARNSEILHKLLAMGCHLTWEEVAAKAGEDVIGRPHFAQVLLDKGYAKDNREVFEKYLGRGCPAYADRRRLSPEDAIKLIRQAGGVAVLAHPFTLKLGKWDLKKLLRRLCDAGLEGIEVYYSEHTKIMQDHYRRLAKDYNLILTGGTDFHGVQTPDIQLGRGFGSLKVPDEVFRQLQARIAANTSAVS